MTSGIKTISRCNHRRDAKQKYESRIEVALFFSLVLCYRLSRPEGVCCIFLPQGRAAADLNKKKVFELVNPRPLSGVDVKIWRYI